MAGSVTISAPAGWPAGLTLDTAGDLAGGLSGAAFSPDRVYRYALTRVWAVGGDTMTWIMLNPSTADAMTDDPTIRRCIGFARREGCDGISVVNLFGYRATDPAELRGVADPVGPNNDRFIQMHAKAPVVVAAWGAHGVFPGRDREVADWLITMGVELKCLSVTADGSPRHPLYVRGVEPLVPWEPPW